MLWFLRDLVFGPPKGNAVPSMNPFGLSDETPTLCGGCHEPFARCLCLRLEPVGRQLMTNTRARELVVDAANRVEEIADGLGDTEIGEALIALSGACRLLADVTERQDGEGRP
jgi:hypothetical protein